MIPQTRSRRNQISADDRPHLVILSGPGLGDFYVLTEDEVVLGSDPFRADVVVRDIEVEPRHAGIYRKLDSGGYALHDIGEKEVLVNGELLEGAGRLLSDGDRISLGDSLLEFSYHDPVKASFYDKLHHLVNRDYLTSLLTKNRFDDEFEHCLKAARTNGFPLSTLMADIDNLKKTNDTHGHLMGEFVVGEIGRIIGEFHLEDGHQATRFGGDEYQSFLPHHTRQKALDVAEEIRSRIEKHIFERDGVTAKQTISLGVASYPEDGDTRTTLTHAADEALYRAKRLGGNAVSD